MSHEPTTPPIPQHGPPTPKTVAGGAQHALDEALTRLDAVPADDLDGTREAGDALHQALTERLRGLDGA